jgi:ureidoglycolate dehydrogenase (NAD+)
MPISIEQHKTYIHDALVHAGANPRHAAVTADALCLADSWGTFTHGSKLLKGYTRRIRAGGCRSDVDPQIVNDGPSFALIDGNSTLGQVAGTFAMETAIEKARETGIAYCGVFNSCHLGAVGVYPTMAARNDMIGIAMGNDIPSVAAPGSKTAVLGTNPFSYSVPAGKHHPILLDMAMSTVAGGKVYAANQLGNPIPNNWIVDRDGKATTDSSLYPADAALQPLGGYKGYGLGLMIESLSGLLSGANLTWDIKAWMTADPAGPTHHGAAFLAFNVGAMQNLDSFKERVDGLIDQIHETPTADGVDQLFVAGEFEWNRYQKSVDSGIDLPADVIAALNAMADEIEFRRPNNK